MSHTMSTREAQLRDRLAQSVLGLRTAIGRCPDLDRLDEADDAAAAVEKATVALHDAISVTTLLASLVEAGEESVLLARSSAVALEIVSAALALVTADLDSRAAA